MATDPNVELADAVTIDLNANVLAALEIVAQRDYLPVLTLESLTDKAQVFVICKSEEATPATRTAQQADRDVSVGVIQKLKRGPNNGFDRNAIDQILAGILLPIKARLNFRPIAGYKWFKTTHDPLYDPEHLDKFAQFTSVVTFSYRRVEP